MRRLIVYGLMLTLAAASITHAQDLPSIACPDGVTVDPLVTLNLPAQPLTSRDDLPESYFVTVITDETKPTLAASNETGLIMCAPQDTLAETVQATFGSDLEPPLLAIGATPYSAWVSADTATPSTATIGQLAGTSLIVIEGGRITQNDDEGDVYTLAFDPAVIDRFDINVLAIDETYQPGFSLVDETNAVLPLEEGQPSFVACQLVLCRIDDMAHLTYTGLRVQGYESRDMDVRAEVIPGETSLLHLRVDANDTEGAYTLLIRFTLVEPEPVLPPIQATDNGDGTWSVQCDSGTVLSNAVRLNLGAYAPDDSFAQDVIEFAPDMDLSFISPETPTTLTAISSDTPLTLAVMLSDTQGYCVEHTLEAASYAVTLPNLAIPSTLNGAQVVLTEKPAFVLIGSSQPTRLALIIEGWDTPTLPPVEERIVSGLDTVIALTVPRLTLENGIQVFALAADDAADPVIGLINMAEGPGFGSVLKDAADQYLMCHNAGVPDECLPDSISLNGYTVTLADGRVLPGASLDASMQFNTTETSAPTDTIVPLWIAAADHSGQGGPLVIVTGFTLSTPEPSALQ